MGVWSFGIDVRFGIKVPGGTGFDWAADAAVGGSISGGLLGADVAAVAVEADRFWGAF